MKNCVSKFFVFIFAFAMTISAFAAANINEVRQDIEKGRFTAAESKLNDVLREHPDSPRAVYWMAQVKEKLGKPKEALDYLESAKRMDSSLKFAGSDRDVKNMQARLQERVSDRPVVSQNRKQSDTYSFNTQPAEGVRGSISQPTPHTPTDWTWLWILFGLSAVGLIGWIGFTSFRKSKQDKQAKDTQFQKDKFQFADFKRRLLEFIKKVEMEELTVGSPEREKSTHDLKNSALELLEEIKDTETGSTVEYARRLERLEYTLLRIMNGSSDDTSKKNSSNSDNSRNIDEILQNAYGKHNADRIIIESGKIRYMDDEKVIFEEKITEAETEALIAKGHKKNDFETELTRGGVATPIKAKVGGRRRESADIRIQSMTPRYTGNNNVGGSHVSETHHYHESSPSIPVFIPQPSVVYIPEPQHETPRYESRREESYTPREEAPSRSSFDFGSREEEKDDSWTKAAPAFDFGSRQEDKADSWTASSDSSSSNDTSSSGDSGGWND